MYLICDISGSMSENGKYLITRNLARSIEQYFRLGYGKGEIKLIAWNKEARFVDWMPDDEFPDEMLNCKGAANPESLIDLMGGQPDGKILLITDGFYSYDNAKVLKRWKNKLPPDTLRIIKTGADADPHLKGEDVFASEDLFLLLNSWTDRSDL